MSMRSPQSCEGCPIAPACSVRNEDTQRPTDTAACESTRQRAYTTLLRVVTRSTVELPDDQAVSVNDLREAITALAGAMMRGDQRLTELGLDDGTASLLVAAMQSAFTASSVHGGNGSRTVSQEAARTSQLAIEIIASMPDFRDS